MTADDKNEQTSEFLNAAQTGERGLVREFIGFMFENKAWWMVPILIVLALVGVIVIGATSGAGAFLYSFF